MMTMQELAHEEIFRILSLPYQKKRRLLIQGYDWQSRTLVAKLIIDQHLPFDLSYGRFKNRLEAEEFVRHLKNYSLHTDVQLM